MLSYVQDLNLWMYFVSLLRRAAGLKHCGVSHPLDRRLQAVSRRFGTRAHLSELLRRTLGEKTLKESNSSEQEPSPFGDRTGSLQTVTTKTRTIVIGFKTGHSL